MPEERVHIIFEARNGLRYDTSIHDFIDADGELASAESVASAWGMTPEEVVQERQEANEKPGKKA